MQIKQLQNPKYCENHSQARKKKDEVNWIHAIQHIERAADYLYLLHLYLLYLYRLIYTFCIIVELYKCIIV